MTPEEIAAAALAAEKTAADKAAADKAAAEKAAADKAAADKTAAELEKLSDGEAKLLKEVMKQKDALKSEKAAAEKAKSDLAALVAKFDGIDPEAARKLITEQASAEEAAALARGEFETVRKQMIEKNQAIIETKDKETADLKALLEARDRTIDDLTVGANFGQSKYVTEETVLSPNKARMLYGSHFDIVDGNVVGYDKPRGSAGRGPIVDATGSNVSFEDAMKKIIADDPDHDTLVRSKLKPGADSSTTKKIIEQKQSAPSGLDKIKLGLKNRAGK